ncbi:MAG: PaaI family thioesterase [Clostridia bacterium]|jgi:acyl-CoA thioesterase|nr:PaaI family thioesterase [Clostridia bacterium]MBQ9400798.1 PaaI family thioesterase [Clostridia bacterium]
MATFTSLQDAREFFIKDRFASENGMTLEALTENGAVCAMVLTGRHQNAEGGVMGGAILALADFTFAAASNNVHRPTVAQQVSFSFLNASKGSRLLSTATCIKSGRSSCVYHIDIKDDLGKDIAQAMFTGFKL